MNNPAMDQLTDEQNAAQKKLILGVIFSAVALFLLFMGIALVEYETGFSLLIVFSLPCFGVGTPFLIIGIKATVSSKQEGAPTLAQPAPQPIYQQQTYQQPVYQQPVYQQPVYQQPVYQQPVYQQPVYQQPVYQQQAYQQQAYQQQAYQQQAYQQQAYQQQAYQQQAYQQQAYQQQAYQQQAYQQQAYQQPPRGFVPLDWRKYNPSDAGVSMKPNKDYQFHRADGFIGSVPQKFVDRTFPRCPICCSGQPHWTIAQHNQMSWKGNLYLFKCSTCDSVISMSMPDVTTLGNGASGIASNPNVGLTNLIVKASSGKKTGAVYAVIESVGRSGVSPECEGKEFELEHLQDMFLRQ